MKKEEKKKGKLFEPLGDFEYWEKGKKISEAVTLRRTQDNVKGISVKVGSKASGLYGKTIWIDEDLDLPEWLGWFIKTIKKLYLKLFSKEIRGFEEGILYYRDKVTKLTRELAETQKKLEETEKLSNEQKELIDLARKSIKDLNSYRETFNNFEKTVIKIFENKKREEEQIKKILKQNPWLFGLECYIEAKNKAIDPRAQIDLHIITRYSQNRIFEIKSPNIQPLVRKNKDPKRRLTFSNELSDGLSELITYMRKTDIYSSLKTEGNYGIQKASGVLLIGYKLNDTEKEILNELNFHLKPHIQIITYEQLLNNIIRELGLIESLK